MTVCFNKYHIVMLHCMFFTGMIGYASAQDNLFSVAAISRTAGADRAPEPGVVRQRYVTLSPTAARDIGSTASGTSLSLNFFDDVSMKIDLNNPVSVGKDGYIRAGTVQGKPLATFQMSVVGEATLLDVRLPDGVSYSLRYRGEGLHEVQEILESAQPSCGLTSQTLPARSSEPQSDAESHRHTDETVAADSAAEIDVLVAYTQDAEIQAGGPSGMQALINQAFAFANTSYSNSLIPLTIVKVATVKVDYTPNSNMQVDLSRIRSTNDGFMDEIHAIRNSFRADMVCLFRGSTTGGACGIGYLMQSESSSFQSSCFVVCSNTCVTNQTFAHELGHNMGCQHDAANGSGGSVFPYSYGWRWLGTGSGTPEFRSVMAYAPGTRIQHFSNPNVNYSGTPTGVAGSANNALSITNTADTVANFRQRAAAPGPTLFSSPGTVMVSILPGVVTPVTVKLGNVGTGTVSYTVSDDATWGSISPANGTITGPGTISHTFTFNSTGLLKGVYNANLTVTAGGATNSPQIVPVQLTVLANPPSNDNFANAKVITGEAGVATGTTIDSTRQTGEPATVGEYGAIGQNSIWYSWTAPASEWVTFTTVGSSFDTLLGCYTGDLGSLTLVADNDEGGPDISSASSIKFLTVAGTDYKILIDGFQGATGSTQLNWSTHSDVKQWPNY